MDPRIVPAQAPTQSVYATLLLEVIPQAMRRTILIPAFALADASALATPVCSDSANPLQCRLNQVLNLLDVAAVVLGLILVAALVFAVRIYRRNRRSDPSLHRAERKPKGSRG